MKARLKKLLSCILALAILIQMAPFEVLAADIHEPEAVEPVAISDVVPEAEAAATDEEGSPEVYIQGEVMDAREEYVKHYRLTDGTFIASQFQVPVHYEDDGEWVDIDNTLQPVAMFSGTEVYQAVNGDHAQAFSATLADGTVMSLAQGDMSISMALWDGTTGEEVPVDSEPEATEEPVVEEPVVEESLQEEVPAEAAEKAEEELAAVTVNTDGTSEPEAVAEPETTEEPEAVEEVPAPEEVAEPETVEETEPEAEPEVSSEPEEVTVEEPEAEPETETALPVFNREAYAQVAGNGAIALASLEEPEEELREVTDVVPETLSNEVLYEGVYPNVDLKYETFSYNVKESIILNAPASEATEINADEGTVTGVTPYVYTFLLDLVDLTPALQEDGSILLLDAANETQFIIPAPYMEDSAGNVSTAVSYTLSEITEGWLLTVTANEEWLEADERVYPVTIDPTILSKEYSQNFMGTSTYSQSTPINYLAAYQMIAGKSSTFGDLEMIFKVIELPEIPEGHMVTGAQVGLTMSNNYSSTYLYLGVSQMTTALTDEQFGNLLLPWNSRPSRDPEMDFKELYGNYPGHVYYWDVTRAALDWYENPASNLGLVIHNSKDSYSYNDMWARFSRQNAVFLVNYRNTSGIESYYTYETQSAVRAGTGYVGDHSSNLTVMKSDLSYPNVAMAYSLGHVYNSSLRKGNMVTSEQEGVIAPDYSAMKFGKGWQLTAQESLKRTTISGYVYLVYRDSDGTQHYMPQTATCTFKDEDGLGLTVISGTTYDDQEYVMTDLEGNEKYFRNGRLMYIADTVGNKVCFLYNNLTYSTNLNYWAPPATGAYLREIVSVNKGQTTGTNICTFAYDSNNYLTSITDYAGRVTSYSYNSDNQLITITHPDGVTTHYQYDNDGQLINMYDSEAKYGIEYDYDGEGVDYIAEYSAATLDGARTPGNRVQRYKNGIQETVYRYAGADGVFDKEVINGTPVDSTDDLVNRYSFDFWGRTINATSLNYDQSRIYGVTAAAYTSNTSTSKTNNRMEKEGQAGQTAVNMLISSGAEAYTNGFAASAEWSTTHTPGTGKNAVVKYNTPADNDDEVPTRTGDYSLKIYLNSTAPTDTDGSRRMGLCQPVQLTQNVTYTLSAYVNTTEVTTYLPGGGVYVAFMDSNGAIKAESERIMYSTSSAIEDGWQRVQVSYTAPSTDTYRVAVMQEDAYLYSYFDDIQLEVGEAPAAANLLQNADFSRQKEDSTDSTVYRPSEWTYNNLYMGTDPTNTGNSVAMLRGIPDQIQRGSQTIPINGPATENYMLSGWACAHAAAGAATELTDTSAETNLTQHYFGLIARVDYTDETKEYFYMPFNDDYTGWQYASAVIAPKKDNREKTIETITVIVAYDNNSNTAAFDNLSLTKEPCATYTYDDDGNMVAVNASGMSEASFDYTAGTRRLTEYSTESGNTYTYEYYSNNLVKKIKNDGVTMDLTYDTAGNSTQTTLSADNDSSIGDIITKATYQNGDSLLATQTSATGNVTTYAYNDDRQLISVDNSDTDGVGAVVETTYHTNTDRPKTNYISGVISAQNYYTNGMLSRIKRGGYLPDDVDRENKLYQNYYMNYDSFGNMTSIAVGNQTLATYTYAANNGNLETMEYGNNHVVSYEYDNLDRVTVEKWNGNDKYLYFYNAEGELSQKLDVSANKAVNYEYDSLGRLIYSWQTGLDENDNTVILQKTEHKYDLENRLASQSWQLGDTVYSESYTYDADDGSISSMTPAVGSAYTFTYDALKRLSVQSNDIITKTYSYRSISNTQTTTQVSSIGYTDAGYEFTIDYTYDELGNIKTVDSTVNTSLKEAYTYDEQGQLLTESGYSGNWTYTYDTYGNIRSATDGTTTHTYTYGDSNWRDLLTAYDGHTINYDAIGNPINWYNTKAWTSLTWQNGRQLASITDGTTNISYTYDVAGIRDSKTVGSTTYNYLTQNGQVVRQTWTDSDGSHVMDFIYDNQGKPYAVILDGTTYYYVLNLQGDVIHIFSDSGTNVATYRYDAWGRITATWSKSGHSIGELNPIRYRGYYYDKETGLYYLQSRYYDPLVKRFVNGDSLASTGQGFIGCNMFVYCTNNPVSNRDLNGFVSEDVADDIIEKYSEEIISAAEEYDVDPVIVALCIYTEQVQNVDFKDKLTDWLYLIDPSVGIGQVRISTAMQLEEDGYIEKTLDSFAGSQYIPRSQSVQIKLSDPETNIRYVAACVRYWQNTWASTYDVSNKPAILCTLYNLGGNANKPNKNPRPNHFGTYAWSQYTHVYELLK